MTIEQIALITAVVGAVGIGLAHSILGEQGIVKPILKRMNWHGVSPDAEFLNGTVRFAWHITTLAWIVFFGIAVGAAWPYV